MHYFSSSKNSVSSYRTIIKIDDPLKYKEYFLEMYKVQNYLCLLNDLSILSGFYEFSSDKNNLIKAKLEYLPNPGFIANREFEIEELNEENVTDDPLSYYSANYIRLEFDNSNDSYKPIFHPCSHLHLGLEIEYRIALDKFPYFSEFVNLILFYNYSEQWRKLIPRMDAFEKPIDSNLDFAKYLHIRIHNKSDKYIQSALEPFEVEHYIFNI